MDGVLHINEESQNCIKASPLGITVYTLHQCCIQNEALEIEERAPRWYVDALYSPLESCMRSNKKVSNSSNPKLTKHLLKIHPKIHDVADGGPFHVSKTPACDH